MLRTLEIILCIQICLHGLFLFVVGFCLTLHHVSFSILYSDWKTILNPVPYFIIWICHFPIIELQVFFMFLLTDIELQ